MSWEPAPNCTAKHFYGEEGWRPGGIGEPHEHWVDEPTEWPGDAPSNEQIRTSRSLSLEEIVEPGTYEIWVPNKEKEEATTTLYAMGWRQISCEEFYESSRRGRYRGAILKGTKVRGRRIQ